MNQKFIDGLLIVDKPKDWTSHDVVAKLKNTLRAKKVGHGGTLDPDATGVLIILLGSYTKRAESFLGLDKSYRITMEFGRSTTTGDAEGETVEKLEIEDKRLGVITTEALEHALNTLTGIIPQQVPWFSAIKIDGKKLYQYARGKSPDELRQLDQEIQRPVRDIEIFEARLVSFEPGTGQSYPSAIVEISCSSGTYTRVFVEDLGKALAVPAYQTGLVRTDIGEFSLDGAVSVDHFDDPLYLQSKIGSDPHNSHT